VDVVSRAASGADLRSNVDRPVRESHWLRAHGDQIFILRLQGFIFFGTATHLLHQVRDRTKDPALPQVRFVIMDFRRVTGLDSSAVFSLWKVHQLARKLGFTLLMTQVHPDIERQLSVGGLRAAAYPSFRLMQDLDHGLEWCENHLLTDPNLDRSNSTSRLHEQLKDLWPSSSSPEHLLSFLEPATVAAGNHLIRQSDPSNCLYFIESGQVSVRLPLENGRHLRLRTMGPGTVVGEMGLILGSKRAADVVAENDCSVYRLDQGALDRIHQENPPLELALHQYLVKLLAERLTTTSNMLRGMQ
jgi:SulP family sulfate permease